MSNVEKLQAENRQLQLAINELKVLNDVATTISSVQSVDEIIDQIVMKCIKHIGVEEGTVNLLEHNKEGEDFHTMVRHKDTSGLKVPYRMDAGLKGWMLKNRTSFLSNDIRTDERFQFLSDDEYPFRSILCVPLIVKGEMIGYLAVFNKREGEFSSEDRRLLSIIGSQSAQIIENARLLEEEKMLISMKEEMKMASEIQRKLLPDAPPEIEGYHLFAMNIPAKSVGGDYYDFVSISDGRLAFCLGDITGKGMPAAMLMANLQATFRSQVLVNDDCAVCITRTNKLLYRSTESTKFATMVYGALNPKTGQINYTNGGHDCPVHFKKNQDPKELDSTGLILGIFEDSDYSQESIQLEGGDLLLLFSDGISEAMNSDLEMYGTTRLKNLVQKNLDKTTEEIGSMILADIREHVQGNTQSDDITLMLIKRN